MPSDIELVDDNVLLTGNDVLLTGGRILLAGHSVVARCDLLLHEGSPLVLSTRDLFITWSIARANLHIGALVIDGAYKAGNETDAGEHDAGHAVRVEGVICADDVRLVSWMLYDPKETAKELEILRQAGVIGDKDDESLEAPEPPPETGGASLPSEPREDDRFRDVDASEREERLPTIEEGLRSQPKRLVRLESSLVERLVSIEANLERLDRNLASIDARLRALEPQP